MRPLNALAAVFVTTLATVAFAQSPAGLVPVYTGPSGLESPTVDAEGNVYFSNLGAGGISKMDTKGTVTPFRDVRSNGIVFDPQFRLLVIDRGTRAGGGARGAAGGRGAAGAPAGGAAAAAPAPQPAAAEAAPSPSRLLRIDVKTGNTEVLADSYEGKPFTGLNDVTIDGKGGIWFTNDIATDPAGVYHIDAGGKLTRVLGPSDVQYPNGLIISPDDKILYVIETNAVANGHRRITAFDLSADGRATNPRMFHDFYPGRSGDGMTVDSAGNIWVLAGLNKTRANNNGLPSTETLDVKAGLYEIAPNGRQVNFWPITEDLVTNAGFGGPDLRTLYISGGKTLYTLQVTTPGTRR